MELTRQQYPATYDYLGIGTKPYEPTQLSADIETLAEIFPLFVTMIDEDKSLIMPNIEIGYIIRNLQRVRDELRQKGGHDEHRKQLPDYAGHDARLPRQPQRDHYSEQSV